jgi:hypothetical protein
MADNTQLNVGTGGDLVSTDELTTVNGVSAPAGLKVQRVKAGFGVDGVLTDVSSANPFPVTDSISAEAQQDMINLLTRMLNYLNAPMGYDKSLQRSRQTAIIESGTIGTVTTVGTTTTVGTVSNVANQTLMGGVQAQILVNGGNMAAWQAAVRNRIT